MTESACDESPLGHDERTHDFKGSLAQRGQSQTGAWEIPGFNNAKE